jgi:hypothetical protein
MMNAKSTLAAVFLNAFFVATTAMADPVTIDFEEYVDRTSGTAYTKGYVFEPTPNSYSSGVTTIYNFGPGYFFSAYKQQSACGSGCFATAKLEFYREDGGPFALYDIDVFDTDLTDPWDIDPDVVEGRSAIDGSWFTFEDNPAFGVGPWLNISAVRYERTEEAVDTTVNVRVWADNVVVEEIINIDIDFDLWNVANDAYPQNDYEFNVAVKSQSVANGDPRDFDATSIDWTTAKFGPTFGQATEAPFLVDLEGDGDTDIVLDFLMQETGITCLLPSNEVKLVATTTSGEVVAGTATINKLGCDGTELLDFEEQPLGASSALLSKGFRVQGYDSSVVDAGGNKRFSSEPCEADFGGCYFHYASQQIQRMDGQPFALYGYDFQAGCFTFSGGCSVEGVTTWGDTVRPSQVPVGTAGWLNLSSFSVSVSSIDNPCDGCYVSLDDLAVRGSVTAQIDYDQWSETNETRPGDEYEVGVAFFSTSVADGEMFDFDATDIDASTLRYGPDGALASTVPLFNDWDDDGDLDAHIGFRFHESGIDCTTATFTVGGQTNAGLAFVGIDTVVPVGCEEPMAMDVEPYSSANRVYPDDDYLLQVALLSTSIADGDAFDFSPSSVSRYSLRFGPGEAQVNTYLKTDVDSDGDTDIVYTFAMQDTGITCGDTEVSMTGDRYAGGELRIPMVGSDNIQTEDCETECHP